MKLFFLLCFVLLVNSASIIDKVKKESQEKREAEKQSFSKWVVKLKDGVNPNETANKYGFSNAGAIRDLPGSFIYNILPQYKANIVHHIKMLQAAPEVASFVQYHPDEIKKHFKKEYQKLEEATPGSATKILEEARSKHSESDKEILTEELKKAFKSISKQDSPIPQPKTGAISDWVVLLKPNTDDKHIASKYGFSSRGHIKDSTLNNYLFRVSADKVVETEDKVAKLRADPEVLDIMKFDIESLKKRREELLNNNKNTRDRTEL